jgi:tetratricopeptide (TPR) repeat protein
MADTYRLLVSGFVSSGSENFSEGFAQVHAYADKALELNPNLPEALFAKASVVWAGDLNVDLSAEYYAKALQLDPHNSAGSPGTATRYCSRQWSPCPHGPGQR